MTRRVIFHHHIFKNAGTSVDRALRAAFAERWRPLESRQGPPLQARQLREFLEANPEVVAVSSHTFRFPLPAHDSGIEILPIAFLRHPLDRVRSAYDFERRQNAESFGARLAKAHDFAGYVRERLSPAGDRAISNFQTRKLSSAPAGEAAGGPYRMLLSALEWVASAPAIGLVECFEASMARYETLIASALGHPVTLRRFHANAGRSAESSLEERVRQAEAMLGPELLERFVAANRADFALYNLVRRSEGLPPYPLISGSEARELLPA